MLILICIVLLGISIPIKEVAANDFNIIDTTLFYEM